MTKGNEMTTTADFTALAPEVEQMITDGTITREQARNSHNVALILAGALALLAQDPEVRDMAENNDLEHFTEGCRNPAFGAKLTTALVTIASLGTEGGEA